MSADGTGTWVRIWGETKAEWQVEINCNTLPHTCISRLDSSFKARGTLEMKKLLIALLVQSKDKWAHIVSFICVFKKKFYVLPHQY
jgi:hypothetical protein